MKHQVQIINGNHKFLKTLDVEHGELLHNAIIHERGYHAPCGGKGKCKKCKVKVMSHVPYTLEETSLLTEEEIRNGVHFACLLTVTGDITLQLSSRKYQIAEDIYEETSGLDPFIKRTYLPTSNLKDGIKSDYITTLKHEMGVTKVSLDAMRKLPEIINSNVDTITLIHSSDEVIAVSDKKEESYGIAIDIGTTTVVSYLYNLSTGEYKDVFSDINHQKNFGFDVITRIKHAHHTKGLNELSAAITQQINSMIAYLLRNNSIDEDELDEIVIVGNTVMMHLLLNVNPKDIGAAPFTPVFTETIYTDALNMGLQGSKHCKVILVPSIAAYVGADIVSGIIATNLYEDNLCALLIDIGTNGEIALLNQNHITCCATAAGPAFEGANITYGVGGVFGAINKVVKNDGKFSITTINDEAPIGICGSGLIDGVAYLLESGYVDETGYLEGDDLVDIEGMSSFELARKSDGTPIYINQKDIREIQLAKGSIRAGIETMLYESGITVEAIDKVYIAGGFGSYMNKESAIKIGLLPKELEHKIVSIGNSAGIGAIKVLLNKEYLQVAKQIKSKCKYVELSNSVKFMDYYMESMSFQ